jgi:hypothetical protein
MVRMSRPIAIPERSEESVYPFTLWLNMGDWKRDADCLPLKGFPRQPAETVLAARKNILWRYG